MDQRFWRQDRVKSHGRVPRGLQKQQFVLNAEILS